MRLSRRQTLALAAAATAAACHKRRLETPAPHGGEMDTHVLDAGFPALASRARPGAFAMGVMDLATTKTWYWNTNRGFPLAGAAALPIATAAMAEVDAGKLSLGERIRFGSLDLSPFSLITQAWPDPPDNRSTSMRASDLIQLALREGDSTAIDVLMNRIGGPGAVAAFLQLKGVLGLRVDRYQRGIVSDMFAMPAFRPAWKTQAAFDAARDRSPPTVRQAAMDRFILDPRDTATVPAALGFLALLTEGELVSANSTRLLLDWMQTAPGSLFAAGLPAGTPIAHTSGQARTDLGFTPATTELAIATFPSGRRYALAGFLIGSTATAEGRRALFGAGAALATKAIG